jgi:putative component of toxin-antitoxin plasmid stabilization module
MDVRHYVASDGRDPFQDWLDALPDARARVAVLRRIDRLARSAI